VLGPDREQWLRADPWKTLFESSAPIEGRGLSPEEIARIAALRQQWKRLTDDEKAVQIAVFKRQFADRTVPEMTDTTTVSLDGEHPSHGIEHHSLDGSDVELTTIHVTPVETTTSLQTVNSMVYDDTTALQHPGQFGIVDDRDLTRQECQPDSPHRQPIAPPSQRCCCVVM
jgi:hypothetical protein